jgi:cyclohexadienyl dehydratase
MSNFTKIDLKVGTPADYTPFSFMDEVSSDYVGFDIDLIKYIAKELSVELQFIKTTWHGLSKDLEAKKFDIAIGGISLTENRKQDFLTSIATMSDGKTLLINKKYANEIISLSDADDTKYTLIANRGGTNEKFVRENIKQAKIMIVEDNMAIFEQIATGVADAMVTDLSEALYRQTLDDRLMVVKPIKLYTQPLGYGFLYKKNQTELKNKIDEVLSKFIQTEQFAHLTQKYFNCKIQF